MKWNIETDFLEYQSALGNIKNMLGINKMDFLVRPELAPYVTRILQYLEKSLIRDDGLDAPIVDKLNIVTKLYNEGADLIVFGDARKLAKQVGGLMDENYDDEIKYDQERFIFSWADMFSSLICRLKLQYSHLLYKPLDPGCPCECSRGDSQETWDNYFSGVWPEDENCYYTPPTENYNNCTCNYRTK